MGKCPAWKFCLTFLLRLAKYTLAIEWRSPALSKLIAKTSSLMNMYECRVPYRGVRWATCICARDPLNRNPQIHAVRAPRTVRTKAHVSGFLLPCEARCFETGEIVMRHFISLVFVTILLLAGWGSPLQAQIEGNIDGITGSTGSQYIQGWACSVGDADPTPVKVFTGGTAGTGQFYAGYNANASITNDPAVVTACGNNDPHMFKIPIRGDLYTFSGQSIYVDVVASDGSYTILTGSGSYNVPAVSTIGHIDSLNSSGTLTGWAC